MSSIGHTQHRLASVNALEQLCSLKLWTAFYKSQNYEFCSQAVNPGGGHQPWFNVFNFGMRQGNSSVSIINVLKSLFAHVKKRKKKELSVSLRCWRDELLTFIHRIKCFHCSFAKYIYYDMTGKTTSS